jgi:hypothetical protein
VTVKTGFTCPVSADRDPRVGIMILRIYYLSDNLSDERTVFPID